MPPIHPASDIPPESGELLSNLVMELHYPSRPRLDAPSILAGVQSTFPRSTFVRQDTDSFCIAHPDVVGIGKEMSAPVQTVVSLVQDSPQSAVPSKILQQTFDWPGSSAAAAKSRSRVILTEMPGESLSPEQRIGVINAVLRTLLEKYPPVAVASVHAEKLVDPVNLRVRLDSREPLDPFRAHVNVRFHILSKRPGETIMDTLGLTTLNLHDFQCHFRRLDPNRMAPFLFNAAFHLYTQGLVIQNGSYMRGLEPDTRWKCVFERSLLPPFRHVIDLDPGEPFAAGDRSAQS